MIRFIHTGDLHLGLQFKDVAFHRDKAENRRLELWNTFERIVYKAIEDDVDFLFIAGDLFEEEYFTLGDMKRVRDNLAKASDVRTIITAGNHDPLRGNSLYNRVDWPEYVTIFAAGGIEKKEFVDKGVLVYGYSWDTVENREDILEELPDLDEKRINILIIHGDLLDRNSVYLPLDRNLDKVGFDYIGLGHIHKPTIYSNTMAYCGSPEPLDFGEIGPRGIIEGTIDENGTNIEFTPFSKRMFLERRLEIDEDMGYVDIMDELKTIDEESERTINLYRVILKGVVNRDVNLDLEDMARDLGEYFYYIELIDETTMDYDLEALEAANRDNIVGYFIREMKDRGLEDRLTRDALYIGLDVLMKG
ncbi:MAG: DNA repair exonuclease [Tissierellia bacterium]|nr:DNA repair exonuclease [Tissierellia bacterium]